MTDAKHPGNATDTLGRFEDLDSAAAARYEQRTAQRHDFRVLSLVAVLLIVAGIAVRYTGVSLGATPQTAPTMPVSAAEDGDTGESFSVSDTGGVSSSSPAASEAGTRILEEGGNAVDAAVATAFVLSLVEPHASGPGGGGGALIQLGGQQNATFVDFRDVADESPLPRADRFAIPGYVLGMEKLISDYGVLPLSQVMKPAIEIAESGITVSARLAAALDRDEWYVDTESSAFYVGGHPLGAGEMVLQPEAARTLRTISERGAKPFYTEVLQSEVPDLEFNWTELEKRLVVERKPAEATILGRRIQAASAPFSGAVSLRLLEFLAEPSPLVLSSATGNELAQYFDFVNETYDARASLLGDPAFEGRDVTAKDLVNTAPRLTVGLEPEESVTTTHISVIDGAGNAVSMTLTLGDFFGNGKTIGGFFANETLNFAQGGVNDHSPYKKPRTFMSPMLVEDNGTMLALGTPGGYRIPQVLAQVLSAEWARESLVAAVNLPRATVLGNAASFEQYLGESAEADLRRQGFRVDYDQSEVFFGGVNSVQKKMDGSIAGFSDPRRLGRFVSIDQHESLENAEELE